MKTDNILESLKQLFIENNRINLKDRLLERFWAELPKEEYSKYLIIFPYNLKDKFNFNSDLVKLDGILFSEYTDKNLCS